ncbi:glycosyltransferase [Mycobacterium shigaense]|uniref:Glycosyl transferase n=1 Tax=Mycobacterium shigaense TaxID=722731 RepID=A0A1Z4EG56_9MYCO|nr:glycosyltransferase [Mycobacterium shigaense]MEA1125052.1 glycosyltransferase [Mycobacterium shigaense]PRI16640.1 glycosyl transferase [Mycobacterium shigaense]BAX91922.1 glycosyl transferase [Mycobacterium shigaense]
MRVLLTTYDSRGGVEPLLGLAVQLQALGAEVVLCAPPDEEFAQRAAGFDVPLVPFGEPVRVLSEGASRASEEDVRRQVLGLIDAQFDTVAAAAQGCDALLSAGLIWTSAGARSVCEKLGIHYVYASYHPTHLPSPHHPPPEAAGRGLPSNAAGNRLMWDNNARGANVLFGPTLNGHRASLGMPLVGDLRAYAHTERPWLASDPTLGPWPQPADIDVVQTGAWLLRDERPLPDDLEEFLNAGAPPVYVGFGSMPLWGAKDLGRTAVEAIREQGRRALLARGWAELDLIDGADDCFVVGEVNQQALFGRVAAAIHHGGAGTTTTAARAGVPQLVIPQGADQVYWAQRVVELGIGTACDGPAPPLRSLAFALEAIVTPATEACARDVARAMRTDGAAVAAKLLLDAAGG